MKHRIRKFFVRCVLLLTATLLLAGDFVSPRAQDAPKPAVVEGLVWPPPLETLPGKGPLPSWAGFPATWNRRRTQFLERRALDEKAVVFLGDSITQGWNSLSNDFPKLKVANRGIGGDITRGVLYRLKADVLDLHPVAVVLLIGTNDLGNDADPRQVADNIEAIILALSKSNPNMPIVVCHIMPRGPRDDRQKEKIKQTNATVAEIAKGYSQVILCDTWSIYANENGNSKLDEFNPDLLHLNAAGYAKWKAALEPILEKLHLPAKTQ